MLAALLAGLKMELTERPSLEVLFGEPRPRHLLAVAGIEEWLHGELEARGCLTGSVPGVAGALVALGDRAFDGVIVRPNAEAGLGLKMVRALKLGGAFPGLSERFLEPLRRRLAATPFWIAPLPGTEEYGFVLANGSGALARQTELPMAEAICRLKAFERRSIAEA